MFLFNIFVKFLFISKVLRFYVKIPSICLREVPGLIPEHSRKKIILLKVKVHFIL